MFMFLHHKKWPFALIFIHILKVNSKKVEFQEMEQISVISLLLKKPFERISWWAPKAFFMQIGNILKGP